jgi:hypothetical protein
MFVTGQDNNRAKKKQMARRVSVGRTEGLVVSNTQATHSNARRRAEKSWNERKMGEIARQDLVSKISQN